MSKTIRPMYIFTVLAVLLVMVLFTITHTTLTESVNTILTTVSGGLLTLLGTVVNYEFGSAKPREQAVRAADIPVGAPEAPKP